MEKEWLKRFEEEFLRYSEIAKGHDGLVCDEIVTASWFVGPKDCSEILEKLQAFIAFLELKIKPQLDRVCEKMKESVSGGVDEVHHLTSDDLQVQKLGIVLERLKDIESELVCPPSDPSASGEDKDNQY